MESEYNPPKVWKPKTDSGGKFSGINRPTAGAREERTLPEGKHQFQLYSMATPNGVKVTTMFEELLELGVSEAEYDAFHISILEGDQFTSGFVDINPNSKIPALVDKNNGSPIRLFESGSILLYLADKFKKLIPESVKDRAEVLNWLFWQMGSAPYLGGGFGHFYAYAPEKIEYAIDRFSMEAKRQLDVLDKQLEKNQFIAGSEYSIADIAIYPWYGWLVQNQLYSAAEFLSVEEYKNVLRWSDQISKRPAVKRGRVVNRTWGEENEQLKERHSKEDFNGLNLN